MSTTEFTFRRITRACSEVIVAGAVYGKVKRHGKHRWIAVHGPNELREVQTTSWPPYPVASTHPPARGDIHETKDAAARMVVRYVEQDFG